MRLVPVADKVRVVDIRDAEVTLGTEQRESIIRPFAFAAEFLKPLDSCPELCFAQGLAMIPARVKVAATVIEEHFFAVRSGPAEQRRWLDHAIHHTWRYRRTCIPCALDEVFDSCRGQHRRVSPSNREGIARISHVTPAETFP